MFNIINRIIKRISVLRGIEPWQEKHSKLIAEEIKLLNRYLDDFKCSFDVVPELCEEWHSWKKENPINESPMVSVIVATRNRAHLLRERSLPSILNQSYHNLQVIVVGDCCTDNTEQVVKECDDPRISFHNLTNRNPRPSLPELSWCVGSSQPGNLGLSIAKGDYITHLDDDDEYVCDRISKLVQFCMEDNNDIAWHPFETIHTDGRRGLAECLDFRYGHVTTGGIFYRSWFSKIPWDENCYRYREVHDWNRFRKMQYIRPKIARYPEPLLIKHSS